MLEGQIGSQKSSKSGILLVGLLYILYDVYFENYKLYARGIVSLHTYIVTKVLGHSVVAYTCDKNVSIVYKLFHTRRL